MPPLGKSSPAQVALHHHRGGGGDGAEAGELSVEEKMRGWYDHLTENEETEFEFALAASESLEMQVQKEKAAIAQNEPSGPRWVLQATPRQERQLRRSWTEWRQPTPGSQPSKCIYAELLGSRHAADCRRFLSLLGQPGEAAAINALQRRALGFPPASWLAPGGGRTQLDYHRDSIRRHWPMHYTDITPCLHRYHPRMVNSHTSEEPSGPG